MLSVHSNGSFSPCLCRHVGGSAYSLGKASGIRYFSDGGVSEGLGYVWKSLCYGWSVTLKAGKTVVGLLHTVFWDDMYEKLGRFVNWAVHSPDFLKTWYTHFSFAGKKFLESNPEVIRAGVEFEVSGFFWGFVTGFFLWLSYFYWGQFWKSLGFITLKKIWFNHEYRLLRNVLLLFPMSVWVWFCWQVCMFNYVKYFDNGIESDPQVYLEFCSVLAFVVVYFMTFVMVWNSIFYLGVFMMASGVGGFSVLVYVVLYKLKWFNLVDKVGDYVGHFASFMCNVIMILCVIASFMVYLTCWYEGMYSYWQKTKSVILAEAKAIKESAGGVDKYGKERVKAKVLVKFKVKEKDLVKVEENSKEKSLVKVEEKGLVKVEENSKEKSLVKVEEKGLVKVEEGVKGKG